MSHPSGFRPASRACPAVYLQPNHWWHRLDVWAPLTVIPAYHKPHCCQRQENRQVDILQWWTMEMDRTEGLDRKSNCVCLLCIVKTDYFTPPQLNVNQHKIIIKIDKNWLSSSNLFKFLDLSLLKHGEHIGVGSLCSPLLGFLGGLLAQGAESWCT